ncbi:Alpha-ketoglutarate-dependent dioxygenase alkB -like protein 6 [Toxocara canis]|uniref:Alpha-ketoglutarate-dependent dioxygenase alkB-like protein 6 n=1 Tax=Toxocara canis TaxID=6265 RepID=A0A0B2V3Y1_TOXCA|nr:Alpha-ketoglutarate-dependent dioxygenase alkB -like protein 6 [Toxocara canis]
MAAEEKVDGEDAGHKTLATSGRAGSLDESTYLWKGPSANEFIVAEAHTDGPAFYPLVSTISLGSDLFLDYYRPVDPESSGIPKEQRYAGSMLLERRSLILVTDEAYSFYLHEIDERLCDEITDNVFNRQIAQREIGQRIDRQLRVSLTIRNVPKVSKQNLFGLLMRR